LADFCFARESQPAGLRFVGAAPFRQTSLLCACGRAAIFAKSKSVPTHCVALVLRKYLEFQKLFRTIGFYGLSLLPVFGEKTAQISVSLAQCGLPLLKTLHDWVAQFP